MTRLVMSATAAIVLIIMPAPGASTQEAAPARDPDAMAALERMGTSLRSLQSFAVRADVTEEEVLTTGQKLQFGGTLDIRARRPNALRMDIVSDRVTRSLYYDGRTATWFAPRLGYYASFPAPDSIAALMEQAADRYDLELPLADLFAWGTDPALVARVTSAFRVGTETIGGLDCAHYALRQQNVDWQVWIREGNEALPCKLVITSTDDPAMPQYAAELTWQPRQTQNAAIFTFTPPEGARQIAIARADAPAARQ